jgi:Cu+-exporting ATPase
MTKQAMLKVGGMHCSGCVANVEKALKGLKGVSSVSVDLKGGQASVDYDPAAVNEKQMAEAVTKAGYKIG